MMVLNPQQLLQKATMTSTDFQPVGTLTNTGAAPLTLEQANEFLRLAITPQQMLPDVRRVTSSATKWQESKIDFADHILHQGAQATRLDALSMVQPTTGITEISTVLLRGEVPISDEVFEDQVERAGFGDTVMTMIAEAVGRDLEDLVLNGDTTSGDPFYSILDGWLVKVMNGTGAHVVNAVDRGQDYQSMFRSALSALPAKYKRDPQNMRYYTPVTLVEKYREALAARGTPLGDLMISGTGALTFQGIPIVPVPLFGVTNATPSRSYIMLTHRMNLIYGVHRDIRMETFRDPREGATSFVVSCRVDSEVSHPPASVLVTNVDVTP